MRVVEIAFAQQGGQPCTDAAVDVQLEQGEDRLGGTGVAVVGEELLPAWGLFPAAPAAPGLRKLSPAGFGVGGVEVGGVRGFRHGAGPSGAHDGRGKASRGGRPSRSTRWSWWGTRRQSIGPTPNEQNVLLCLPARCTRRAEPAAVSPFGPPVVQSLARRRSITQHPRTASAARKRTVSRREGSKHLLEDGAGRGWDGHSRSYT
jgi:hypothetical protein